MKTILRFVEYIATDLQKLQYQKTVNYNCFLKNIKRYLESQGCKNDIQARIGYKYLFKGIIVKNWYTNNVSETGYTEFNKIIVKHSILYYWK